MAGMTAKYRYVLCISSCRTKGNLTPNQSPTKRKGDFIMDTKVMNTNQVADILKIDMRDLIQKGYKSSSEMKGRLSFNGNDIAICILKSDCMSLFYQQKKDWNFKYVNKEIFIDFQSQHNESMSPYFMCPKCFKRTLVLYHRHTSLTCRQCSNLTSKSKHAQYEFMPFKGK